MLHVESTNASAYSTPFFAHIAEQSHNDRQSGALQFKDTTEELQEIEKESNSVASWTPRKLMHRMNTQTPDNVSDKLLFFYGPPIGHVTSRAMAPTDAEREPRRRIPFNLFQPLCQ
eukprot:m.1645049 g.1645049  ORF g.1645049 m.1645049 type:complete len:116 (+) comp65388_c0_seq1:99-446(+)